MAAGPPRLFMAALGFSVLIVVLTLGAIVLLKVRVDAKDWAAAIVTAVVVGGFLTLLVVRRGLEAPHEPRDDGPRGDETMTSFDVEGERVIQAPSADDEIQADRAD